MADNTLWLIIDTVPYMAMYLLRDTHRHPCTCVCASEVSNVLSSVLCFRAIMAGMMDGDVLIHEADIPNEDFGDQFDAPEFMTLEQASKNLDKTVFKDVKSSVWPNVVQVIVPVTQKKTAYGTGFIF